MLERKEFPSRDWWKFVYSAERSASWRAAVNCRSPFASRSVACSSRGLTVMSRVVMLTEMWNMVGDQFNYALCAIQGSVIAASCDS